MWRVAAKPPVLVKLLVTFFTPVIKISIYKISPSRRFQQNNGLELPRNPSAAVVVVEAVAAGVGAGRGEAPNNQVKPINLL